MSFDWQAASDAASVWALPVLLATAMREAAHGRVAWRLGDGTAHRLGRVSFNPLNHIYPFGTVLPPALLLLGAAADDVRIRQTRVRRLRRPSPAAPRHDLGGRRGTRGERDAGGACRSRAPWRCLPGRRVSRTARPEFDQRRADQFIAMCFNMLPVPPLDGGGVAAGVLPRPLAARPARLERPGFVIILAAFFAVPFAAEKPGMDVNIFWWLAGAPAEYLMNVLFGGLGLL